MNPLKLLYTVIDSIKFLLSYPLLSREDKNVFLKAYGLRWSLILILTLVIYLFGFDFLLFIHVTLFPYQIDWFYTILQICNDSAKLIGIHFIVWIVVSRSHWFTRYPLFNDKSWITAFLTTESQVNHFIAYSYFIIIVVYTIPPY